MTNRNSSLATAGANGAAEYCTCHDPACRGCGHCVDNIAMKRPNRQDMLDWLERNAKG